jgi:hypothetical protein
LTTAKEQNKKELEELKGAAQVVVDMVDPLEEGVVSNRTLLKRLRETPKKFPVMYQRPPRPTWSTS